MRIFPISMQIINSQKYNNTLNEQKKVVSFCGDKEDDLKKVQEDISILEKSASFQKEMHQLKKESLKELKSYDDFVVASMPVINKYTKNFKIKEDFFEYKAKRRLKKIADKFDENKIKHNFNDYVKYHYWWGFSNKKFGSSYAFSVALSAISPFLKDYKVKLQIANIKSLEKEEKELAKTSIKKEKISMAKEEISDLYIRLIPGIDEANDIKLPNSIMIEGENKDILQNLVQWTMKSTLGGSILIPANAEDSNATIKNKLRSGLEKSQKLYKDTGLPTLIYCENFDKLLIKTNSPIEISAMKALLSSIYEKYGATVLFTTNDSDKFDSVLIQPHRMKKVKIDISSNS